MNKPSLSHKVFLPIIPITIACAIFLRRFGFQVLDVTNINRLAYHEDLTTHYLGWLFFRNESWVFPLGKISEFMYPIGTNIVLTDSNPLIAIPLKLISFLIPTDFQFIGIWLLVCCCLQAYWGYRLVTTMTRDPLLTVFGSIFFVISPPILFRMMTGHDTLCAHWIILAALFFYFSSNEQTSTGKLIAEWSILVTVGAMVHPYMGFMVFVLAMSFSFSHFLALKKKFGLFLFSLLLYSSQLLIIFTLIGPLGATGLGYGENGFGDFSMNLNAFWNPMGFSSFLGALPLGPKQYEGFNYLGLGAILLIVSAALVLLTAHRKINLNRKQVYFYAPLLVALTFLFLLAASHKVSYGNNVVTLFNIPHFLDMPFGVFRASGRFGWPLYYAILYVALYIIFSQTSAKYSVLIIVACLAVQVADLRPLLRHDLTRDYGQFVTPLNDPFWEKSAHDYSHVVIYPPFLKNIIANGDYKYLALYAARHGMTIDTGYVARSQDEPMNEYRKDLEKQITSGHIDSKNLYILPSISHACELMRHGSHCYTIDGYNLCVSKPIVSESGQSLACKEIALDDFLEIYRDRITILVISHQAYSNFSERVKDSLRAKEPAIDKSSDSKYYVFAITKNNACKSMPQNNQTWSVTFHQGDLCGKALTTDIRISLKSLYPKPLIKVECGGIVCSENDSGINAIVVNENGSVLLTNSEGLSSSDKVHLLYPDPRR